MDDTQEIASAMSRDAENTSSRKLQKRVEAAMQKQTVVTNGQLEKVVVTGSIGRYGLKEIRKKNQRPENNRNLTL